MKKAISILISILLILAMVSCTGNSQNEETQVSESAHSTDSILQESEASNTGASSNPQEPSFKILEVGGYDFFSGANHQEEVNLDSVTYTNSLIPADRTLNKNESTYNVQYEHSKKGYLYNNDLDYYRFTETGKNVEVGFNSKTDRIESFSWMDVDYVNGITTEALSREECLDLAKEYLSDYIDDVSEYQLIDERYLEIPEYKAIYDFEFARVIDGVKTSDSAYVGITVYGTVVSHLFTSLGEMENAALPSEEDMHTIRANIDEKIESIYSNISDTYSMSYEVEDTVFVKLSDGTYALEYYIVVNLEPSGSFPGIRESTRLLVYLD